MSELRDGAASVVTELAVRMMDPPAMVAAACAQGDVVRLSEEEVFEAWEPLSLTNGYPAIALMFAELSQVDGRFRAVTHRYLRAASDHIGESQTSGLFGGPGSLAVAVRAAQRSETDYHDAISQLDNALAARAHGMMQREQERITAGAGPTAFEAYDVINGLAGLGRYFLQRGTGCRQAVRDVLDYLVRLSQPIEVHGAALPGWWVGHAPMVMADHSFPTGHANLGLAHGIPGPLALLAVAFRAGHRVAGQEAAIATMAEWLLEQRKQDEAGAYWPRTIPTESHASVERPSWCYGTPGIARALQLAGRALARPDWLDAAHDAVHAMMRRLGHVDRLNAGLCHGRAGLLQTLWRLNAESADAELARFVDAVAESLVDEYDPSLRVGYQVRYGDVGFDFPGFLDGTAGIVLALHTYATGAPPVTEWDATMLLV